MRQYNEQTDLTPDSINLLETALKGVRSKSQPQNQNISQPAEFVIPLD